MGDFDSLSWKGWFICSANAFLTSRVPLLSVSYLGRTICIGGKVPWFHY